jgi:hypothetical protein
MTVTVSNVDPLIEVGKEGTTSIAGFGTFFFGRAGYETRMHLTTSDVGTDDLIVDLANGGTAVFRNNSNTPDPAQSSSGVRPFSVQFDSGIVYPLPGVFTAEFKVTDDDGGTGKAGAAVLVRGVESGLLDVSGWLARFQGSAAASTLVAADDGALLGYLKVASYMSRVFGSESALSNSLSLSSVAQAAGILAAGGSGNDLAAARALLLAALLNFVSGAEEWGTLVDTDGDGRTDSAYMLVLDEAERLILKPDASSADFARVCALLRACPQPEQKPSPGFTDVPDNHPYREAIEGLTSLGIISGFQDGSFRPDGDVTRQQFAKLIVKTLGLDVTGTEICPFVDVTPGGDETDSCYPDKYIAVCVTHGIILGKTLTTFAPYASITRQQLLSMVARAAMLAEPPADFDPGFAVGQFSQSEHYLNARKAAYAGLCEGLVGVGPAYDFRGVATRGECAQLLWRLLKSES